MPILKLVKYMVKERTMVSLPREWSFRRDLTTVQKASQLLYVAVASGLPEGLSEINEPQSRHEKTFGVSDQVLHNTGCTATVDS